MKFTYVISAAMLVAGSGVHAEGMSMPTKTAASASKAAVPMVNAEVVQVDLAKGLIVLNHGEITNIGMPAMTMGFDVADKKLLAGVKAGQKVRFQVEMVSGKPTVTQLKPAP